MQFNNIGSILLLNLCFYTVALLAFIEALNIYKGNQKYLLAILYFILVYVCVNKPIHIADNMVYKYYFENYEYVDVEETYKLLSSVVSNFSGLLFTYASLSVGLKLYAINKLSSCISISVLNYLAMYFVLHDMIQIRAAVAIGLFLYSIPYLCKRDFRYFLFIIVAFFFHNSSILFLFVWFISNKDINKFTYLLIIPISYLLAFMNLDLGSLLRYIEIGTIQEYYSKYVNHMDYKPLSIFGPVILFRIIIASICVIKSHILSCISQYSNLFIKLYVFSISIYIILMSSIPVMAGRLSEMLGVTEIFVLALFTRINKNSLYKIIPILYCVFMFIIRTVLLNEIYYD